MAGIRVTHSIDDLASDLREIAVRVPKDARSVVRQGIRAGAELARGNAERTAGKHGKHYPRAITSEMRTPFFGFGAAIYSGEYGPDIAKLQGGMGFEHGSRNQPPHLDLAKSTDVIGGSLAQEVRQLPDEWFWPGADA